VSREDETNLGFVGSQVLVGELLGGEVPHGGEACKWKKRRVIKSCGGSISLVVGDDISVDKIGLLEGKMLVGKFIGWRVSMR
jgi:hypothetical protein